MSYHRSTLLVADDEPLNLEIISEFLEDEDYAVVRAGGGAEALARLESEPDRFDAIILDRMMPEPDGLQVLARIKSDARLKVIPVIIQTAAAARDQITEGLRAGAYYYLTKPYEKAVLRSVVRTAVADRANYRTLQSRVRETVVAVRMMQSGEFRLRTVDEANALAALLAHLTPSPDIVVLGLAELMINAIEHGNLGIGYEQKSQLLAAGSWQFEVRRRLGLPENAGKHVRVDYVRDAQAVHFRIRDDGAGFDWPHYLDLNPARALDAHGRGIAIARKLSFTRLEYAGCGNEVTATVGLDG